MGISRPVKMGIFYYEGQKLLTESFLFMNKYNSILYLHHWRFLFKILKRFTLQLSCSYLRVLFPLTCQISRVSFRNFCSMRIIFYKWPWKSHKGRSRLSQKNLSTTQEAENFLKPKILYKFYIALLDIIQMHILCSLGVENPCVHK